MVEDLGLSGLGGWDQVLVKNVKDILADLGELGLNLLTVLLDESDLASVALGLLLLLDGGDDSPGSTAGTNDVLVGDGEKVALFDGLEGLLSVLAGFSGSILCTYQLLIGGGDLLHLLDHLLIALSLPGYKVSIVD